MVRYYLVILYLENAMTSASISPVAIKIDFHTRERVKQLATARKRTPHWLMKEAITQYVDREEKREAFKQDALNAWDEYQVTGLHAAGDEVLAWLDTWGEPNEMVAPVCHK